MQKLGILLNECPSLPEIFCQQVLPIEGYPGYAVCSNGNILSCRSSLGYRSKWRILKPGIGINGYKIVALHDGAKQKTFSVHKLILSTFKGEPVEMRHCRHLNGNRTDNRDDNLTWGTREQNMKDMVAHNSQSKGEHRPLAKLTELNVMTIREQYKNGKKQTVIAEKYGISSSTIWAVVHNRTWKHVGGGICAI